MALTQARRLGTVDEAHYSGYLLYVGGSWFLRASGSSRSRSSASNRGGGGGGGGGKKRSLAFNRPEDTWLQRSKKRGSRADARISSHLTQPQHRPVVPHCTALHRTALRTSLPSPGQPASMPSYAPASIPLLSNPPAASTASAVGSSGTSTITPGSRDLLASIAARFCSHTSAHQHITIHPIRSAYPAQPRTPSQ